MAVLDEESKSKDEESKSGVVVLCSFSTFVIVHVLGFSAWIGPGGVESTRKLEIKIQIQINVAFELQ